MLLCLKTNLWPFWKACNFLTTLSTNPDFYFLFCSKEHKLTDWGLNVFVEVQSLKWISLEQSLSQGCFLLLPILKYLPPFCSFFFLALYTPISYIFSHCFSFCLFLFYISITSLFGKPFAGFQLERYAQLVPLVTFLLPFYCRYFLYCYLVVRPHLGAKRTDILWNYERRL